MDAFIKPCKVVLERMEIDRPNDNTVTRKRKRHEIEPKHGKKPNPNELAKPVIEVKSISTNGKPSTKRNRTKIVQSKCKKVTTSTKQPNRNELVKPVIEVESISANDEQSTKRNGRQIVHPKHEKVTTSTKQPQKDDNKEPSKSLKRKRDEAVRQQPSRKVKKANVTDLNSNEKEKKTRKILQPNKLVVRTEPSPSKYEFSINDLVMVKIPSYSIWPARIVDVFEPIYMVDFFGTGHK